jgi:two-component system CheB/CheR fusion protein
VQSVLLSDITTGADLDSLVRDELMAFGIRAEGPVRVEGPEVRLKARAAGLMALFIHELALGAVEGPKVSFSVIWRERGEDGSLELIWEDGFSDDPYYGWLERAFHYELKGSLTVKTDSDRRRWVASLPSANLLR